MKPTYHVKVWKDDGWWLARVVTASEGADPSPLNAITQAKSLAKIEEMAQDLIATILDAEEGDFNLHVDYDLPEGAAALLRDAAGARRWLEAAQSLWQGRSAAAARALTAQGLSLREAARLLDLSYQRVDQLLQSDVSDDEQSAWTAIEIKQFASGSHARRVELEPMQEIDVVIALSHHSEHRGDWQNSTIELQRFRERVTQALMEADFDTPGVERDSAAPNLPVS